MGYPGDRATIVRATEGELDEAWAVMTGETGGETEMGIEGRAAAYVAGLGEGELAAEIRKARRAVLKFSGPRGDRERRTGWQAYHRALCARFDSKPGRRSAAIR